MPKMIITKMNGSARRAQPPLNVETIKWRTEYSEDFAGVDGTSLLGPKWSQVYGQAPTILSNQMRLTCTAGAGGSDSCVEYYMTVSGDFDVQIEFSFPSPPVAVDWSVDLQAFIDGTHAILSRFQGATRYWTQGYMIGAGWNWNSVAAAAGATAGKLRIVRVGATMYTHYASTTGVWWDGPTTGRAVGAGNCKIRLSCVRWNTQPANSVLIDNFKLRLGTGFGICEGQYHEMVTGIEECEAENKPESFDLPTGGKLRKYDDEWEHLVKQGNPDDFAAPDSTYCTDTMRHFNGTTESMGTLMPRILGSWTLDKFGYSTIGTPGGNPAVLDNTNHDLLIADRSASIYDPKYYGDGTNPPRGPGGYNVPGYGVCYLAGFRHHYGSISNNAIGDLAPAWGYMSLPDAPWGPWMRERVLLGHDYEPNPFPPPATVLNQHHEAVDIAYPPRWINHWTAASIAAVDVVPAPVGYVPKGAKCGVFMPIILRFLIHKRKKDKIISITAGAKK